MDDILSLILVAIFYLIAAASGKKKKKAKKKARSKGFKTAFDAWQTADGQMHIETSTGDPAGAKTSFAADPGCAGRSIHLHDVPQSMMRDAGEGEDPCHAGGMDAKEALPVYEAELPAAAMENETLRQDMLRGVIMSEILTRPCDRRAAERNRRGYHG